MNLLRRRHLVLLALKLTFRTRSPGFVFETGPCVFGAMDALFSLAIGLAAYTALVCFLTSLLCWLYFQLPGRASRTARCNEPADSTRRIEPVYALPKRKVYHHRDCHHLLQRDLTALTFQPCANCTRLW